MVLKFKSIQMHNFLSFGDASVGIDDDGFVLVKGINNCVDDNASSNGSGKSSIWEALVWCLVGETTRGTKDIVNIHSNNGAYVEVVLTIDENQYIITRYKEFEKIGTNLKVFINGEDKSGKGIRDTEKLLTEYLPDLTGQLLGSVIVLGQGLPNKFTSNSPSGRKDVLEKLSKSDFMIEDIKNRISNRKDQLSQDARKIEDALIRKRTLLQVTEKNLNVLQNFLEDLNKSKTVNLAEVINNYQTQLNAYETEKASLVNSITSLKDEVASLRKSYITQGDLHKSLLLEARSVLDKKIEPLTAVYAEYSANAKMLSTKIADALKVKDVCPTCGHKIDGVVKIDTAPLQNELDNIEVERKLVNDKILAIKSDYATNEQHMSEGHSNILKELEAQGKETADRLIKEEKSLATLNENITATLLDLQKVKHQDEMFQSNLENTTNEIKSETIKIEELQGTIKDDEIVLSDLENRKSIVTKFATIASRDFRGFLLTEVISFIDGKAKEYCQFINGHSNISFELNGNSLDILYNNKFYESLSGGEKQKVDLIIQFAIRDMLCKFLNFSSNIIVLDEIFDNLDDKGCGVIIDLVTQKLTDLGSIFIISHRGNELSIPFDKTILVVKNENGISKIERG